MDNKERLRKWLWLGLDETTAKKYQRKISAENVRIVRNESVAIAGIGALYTICMLALSRVYGKVWSALSEQYGCFAFFSIHRT